MKSANSKTRRLSYGILAVGATCWTAVGSMLAAPISLHDTAPCPYSVDGVCIPERETWGYSATQWRQWPGAGPQPTEATGPDRQLPADVPAYELPAPGAEAELAPPPPVTQQVPTEAAPPGVTPDASPLDNPFQENLPPVLPMNPTDLDDNPPVPPAGVLQTPGLPGPNPPSVEIPTTPLPTEIRPIEPPLQTSPPTQTTPPTETTPQQPDSSTTEPPFELPIPNDPLGMVPDSSRTRLADSFIAGPPPGAAPKANPLRDASSQATSGVDLGPRLAQASTSGWTVANGEPEKESVRWASSPSAELTTHSESSPRGNPLRESTAPAAISWSESTVLQASHDEMTPPTSQVVPAQFPTIGRVNPLRAD